MAHRASALPTILVILGATGDLARRKLIPALFTLYGKNLLPPLFQIVGFSRKDLGDEGWRTYVRGILKGLPQGGRKAKEKFCSHLLYRQGFFEKRSGYNELANLLGFQDKKWRVCSNKIFYLAVPPQYYEVIFRHLAASGLTLPCSPEEGWTRVIVEKPFGKDLKTAERLDAVLAKLFKEEQIYRIDHYLGKETVQNILAFRFSNSFFGPLWNANSIDRITIELLESRGVEERGDFYDGVGALRDVGQNHMLQLLALFTMDAPASFEAEPLRRARTKILRTLPELSGDAVRVSSVRGQYSGYSKVPGVRPNSKTETYFRIETSLHHPAWEGVPIILESGKKLGESKAEVLIHFRHPVPCLCPLEGDRHYENVLRYQIQPQERIAASFWIKRPGPDMVLEEKDFVFDYTQTYAKEEFIDAYEKLLLDVIRGNQTLFVSTDEITASWRFIDPILRAWQKNNPPLMVYTPGALPSLPKTQEKRHPEVFVKSIGIVGLGKMGMNMAKRLHEKGWRVRAFTRDAEKRLKAEAYGITTAVSLRELVQKLTRRRIVWLMVTAGEAVEDVLFGREGIVGGLAKGDIVIDGGNSFYEDSIRRGRALARHGIFFMDAGVSGGPKGARDGVCLMVGGGARLFRKLEPLFQDLALADGYLHVGAIGAGHFVKMVHNGIEYGMMQSLAEGFTVLKKAPFRLDLAKIADLYNHGSVIASRLVGWLASGLRTFGGDLKDVSGSVAHTGEGEWTVKTAKKLGVPVPIIQGSFAFRVKSKTRPSYSGRILSTLRNQFGGHDIQIKKSKIKVKK